MSDIPLPGTQASTLRVNGTMTDWINPIEDCVYRYIIDRWSIDKPRVDRLKEKNKVYNEKYGSHHVWVELDNTIINKETIDTQLWDCTTNLNIFCVMKRRQQGQVIDDLDDMLLHVRTLLMEYNPHWIAGILWFNNFVIKPRIFRPDDEASPFADTWIGVCNVNCFYKISSNFMIDPANWEPVRYSAGELSYKLNE